ALDDPWNPIERNGSHRGRISPVRAPKSKPRNWLPASKKGIGIECAAARGYNVKKERFMVKKTIDRRWLPLNALRAFEGVAKHGSFTAAANALLISQSALSRHVI